MIWCLPKSVYCYGTSAINIRIEARKGQGNVWNQIAVVALIIRNSKSMKKSMRDRLTLRHKAKIHQEENATRITCEQTELVQALKEII